MAQLVGVFRAGFRGNPQDPKAAGGYARKFLEQIEPVFPGLTDHWNSRATVDASANNPYSRGSYAYWRVGQYTQFAGVEKEASGNCHFAGEHCSTDFQGFMEGAAAEGARAAEEVLSSM